MSARGRRSGSDSRCCQPTEFALRWIDYIDDSHEAVVELETWLEGLTPFARNHELGRIDDLLESASFGELEDSGDAVTPIKPIRMDPEIFEIRHTALSKKLRFYHGEPAELATSLVSVHRHIKVGDEHQESQIEFAADRYTNGRDALWSLAEANEAGPSEGEVAESLEQP